MIRRAFTSTTSIKPPDVSQIVFSSVREGVKDAGSDDVRNRILKSALASVPQLGFTTAALRHGCTSLGLSPMAAGAWPRGGAELAEYFVTNATKETATQMRTLNNFESMRVPQKIKAGVLIRLGLLKPYLHQWPDALALMAMPQNAPHSLHNLGLLVDEIWHVTGDRSTDMNWYSKRMLLAGVYTSTELFMTQDKSPNFTETEKFLDRRLNDVAFVGRTSAEVGQMLEFGIKSALGVAASKGWLK
ncbi:ubiquinone biosynthesis protein COQ9 [Rhizoclosmatium globosum]|uniref:Ubiquinone biosynthesis protein n=1 Tax=Rhizoclosmatium globosum TaxID=329046 RepID=A0A1Y2CXV5_9FUNG|nr:ubiquinone biosynthesis protein COQ9 [Rhizoclosmatium globosum]|eukprot:ORY51807.1 ubiquinone biosynthesis protein COQ9 [Rhizoclosmatium globosum]